jgi:hypothetical protein
MVGLLMNDNGKDLERRGVGANEVLIRNLPGRTDEVHAEPQPE